MFFPKIRHKAKAYALTILIQHGAGSPSHCNEERKDNKRHTYKKERKLSLFTADMIIYKENPKESTKNSWT